jgi:hypothetical protein
MAVIHESQNKYDSGMYKRFPTPPQATWDQTIMSKKKKGGGVIVKASSRKTFRVYKFFRYPGAGYRGERIEFLLLRSRCFGRLLVGKASLVRCLQTASRVIQRLF